MNNIITKEDSYKIGGHWNMLPDNTEYVYSYFQARKGSKFDIVPLVGLQFILKKHFLGKVVTQEKIDHAVKLCKAHFGNDTAFNRKGWVDILEKHNGYLPLRIRAIPEGMPITIDNVLMTVENTDPTFPWLTNAMETLLTHVWASSTVCALSRSTKKMISKFIENTSDNPDSINFILHDFGFRSVTSDESAQICGMAHLLNFMGTDTIAAIECAMEFYNYDLDKDGCPGFSVAATEHSIMSALGKNGEKKVLENLLNKYPTGIFSCVSDSYSIYNFVEEYVCKEFKEKILARDGVFVIRPDSITPTHPTPASETLWIVQTVDKYYGSAVNSKGYKVLNPKVRVLWGDGIDEVRIEKILTTLTLNGYAADNMVFGQGSALLQKINRDDARSAFKSSAQCRNGIWYDVFKNPLDTSKASKKGRLSLIKNDKGEFETVKWENGKPHPKDLLVTVYENGKLLVDYTFNQLRDNCKI